MRKIIISEEQKHLIMEMEKAAAMRPLLPSFMDTIESSDNPLKKTGYFLDGSLTKMAFARNKELIDNFSDDIASHKMSEVFSKLSKLTARCQKMEAPIKGELEKICNNVVVKMFDIPADTVKIECEIVDIIPDGEQFHITPDTDEDYEYDDIEAIEMSDSEVKKRRIIDAIACGAAQRIAEKSKKLWLEEVFDVDEDLPHLYSTMMKINEYLVFNNDIDIEDKSHKQGGSVEVTLSNNGAAPVIKARGIAFPILLQESIRGIIELMCAYGLPEDNGEARRVMNISDALENDPWNMRIGPALWDCVCNSVDIPNRDIPYFIKGMAMLSPNEFENIFKNIFAGTKKGKEELKAIYNKAKYDNEYDRFTNDLALKHGRSVIEDDYFSEEELEEGTYGGK